MDIFQVNEDQMVGFILRILAEAGLKLSYTEVINVLEAERNFVEHHYPS